MRNNPKYIIVHCTDVSQRTFDQLKSVNNYHRDVRDFPKSSLGYHVGYHALITGGRLVKCKEDWEEGAHCNQQLSGLSMNFQSLGICMGFDGDVEMPDKYMVPLLREQILKWQKMYVIDDSRVLFHRVFANDKTCPGSLITRDWLMNVLHETFNENVVTKDGEQIQKAKIQDQINTLWRLVDDLKRILFERFGVRL